MRKLVECSIRGCRRKRFCKKLCTRHYDNKRYHNSSKRQKWLQEYCSLERVRELVRLRHCKPSYRYSALKRAAKDAGLGFNITKEQHTIFLQQVCSYCSKALNPLGHALDRKDPSKGYLVENVVPCCADCNSVKSDVLTYEEMKAAMKAVLKVREQNGTK